MKAKYKLAVLILTVANIGTFAQDTTKTTKKIKEYVLAFTNFSPLSISIKYKKQLRPKAFFTIGIVDLSAISTDYKPVSSSSFSNRTAAFSAGLEFGIEFRRSITDNLTFFHGPNLSFMYSTNITRTDDPTVPADQRKTILKTYGAGIPYTFGLLYHLKNHFFISAEINPSIFVSYSALDNRQNPQFSTNRVYSSFSLGNKYGLLSLIYRI